ncbi:MAG: hypothetical protein WCA00_14880 [Candidatus Acidiferrales bacterium]
MQRFQFAFHAATRRKKIRLAAALAADSAEQRASLGAAANEPLHLIDAILLRIANKRALSRETVASYVRIR